MSAYAEKPELINWDYYGKKISKSSLVGDFKKQFEALTVPYPKDYATPEIEQRMKNSVSSVVLIVWPDRDAGMVVNSVGGWSECSRWES